VISSLKSHAVTVGGNNPSQRQITLNEKPVLWANKVKYLGVAYILKVIPVSPSYLTPVESFMPTHRLTDDGPVYHAVSDHLCRAKLTTYCDDRRSVAKFSKSKVYDKVPEENTVFFVDT